MKFDLQHGSVENSAEYCLNPFQIACPFLSGPGIQSLPVETNKENNNTSPARTAPDLIHD